MMRTFQDWIKGSGLDSTFGYLVPKQYQPRHFNKQVLVQCMSEMVDKINSKSFSQYVEEIQDVQLNFKSDKDPNNEDLIRDCFLLHGMLNKIIAGYIFQKHLKGVPMSDVVIPKNIGVPLYEVSEFLKIKYGMTTDFYFNWKIKNIDCSKHIPQFIHVKDVVLLENFSPLKKDQNLFFGGSVVGSHYLFMSAKIFYQINEQFNKDFVFCEDNINSVVSKLQKVLIYVQKMVETNIYLLQNVDPMLFDSNYRKFFSAFQDLKFEGIQKRLSSTGGAGGLDPLFQIFERILGIKFQNGLKVAQETFQRGFPYSILNLFRDCEQHFKIRERCSQNEKLKAAYNKIILEYSKFYTIHRALIQKYVLSKNKQAKYGAAGVNIQDIISRDNAISKQKLQ